MKSTHDYALVLNAGSSSLKFCVYGRGPSEAWRLEARGQIEGIGTSPHFSAKDGAGAVLADQGLDGAVRDGRSALHSLAAWLPSRFEGAHVDRKSTRLNSSHLGISYAVFCLK